MVNWAEHIQVDEKIPFLNFKAGESKIVKFLNDEPKEYVDKTYSTNKICFLVEYEGEKYQVDFNKKVFSTMGQLKKLYPITGKVCRISRQGEKTQTRYSIIQVE